MSRSGRRGRGEGEGGQATVELALTLPILAAMALLIVQVALVARDAVLVEHAARAAAREAAVDPTPAEVRRAALRDTPALKPDRLSTETSSEGGSRDTVIVRVRYRSPTSVPVVGPLLPDVEITTKAAISAEIGHGTRQQHHAEQKRGRNRVMTRGTLRQVGRSGGYGFPEPD